MNIEIVRKLGLPKAVTFPPEQGSRTRLRLSAKELVRVPFKQSASITVHELPNAAIALRILNREQAEVPEGFEVEREADGEIESIWLVYDDAGRVLLADATGDDMYVTRVKMAGTVFLEYAAAITAAAAQVRARQ